MSDLLVIGGAALACGAAGLLVPRLIAALPEPEPEPEPAPEADDADQAAPRRQRKPPPDFSLWGLHAIEREKEPYADLARVRGLGLGSAAASALIGALLGWQLGWVPALAVLLPMVPLSAALAVIDWRTRLLPSLLVLPGTALCVLVGLVLWPLADGGGELRLALIGLVAFRSALWVMWRIFAAGMGFGDVRLAALLGFVMGYVGPAELVVGAYAGFLVFSLPGLLLALAKRSWALMRVGFPFGPFMLLGALIGIVFGQPILDAILA